MAGHNSFKPSDRYTTPFRLLSLRSFGAVPKLSSGIHQQEERWCVETIKQFLCDPLRLVKVGSLWVILVTVLTALGTSGTVIGVEPPTAVVRSTIDEVIRLVTDEELKKSDQTVYRRKLLEETIGQHFDFEEMAKRSLAAHWKNRNKREQQEFVSLFQALLSKTYAGKIDIFAEEKVRYLNERLKDSYAEVQTSIGSKKNDISLDYRLLLKGESWRVYDGIVDGVSLVKNFRVQFDRIIQDTSYEELARTLREKSTDITAP